MQTIYEKMGGTYRQVGDYLLPNIEAPKSPQTGIWGQRRLQYLRTNKRMLYSTMLMGDTLKAHLEEIDKSAEEMFEQLTVQMKAQEGVTEVLKANDQLACALSENSNKAHYPRKTIIREECRNALVFRHFFFFFSDNNVAYFTSRKSGICRPLCIFW